MKGRFLLRLVQCVALVLASAQPLICEAQNPFGFKRPPQAGRKQEGLDKIEKRANEYVARGTIMGDPSAYTQWRMYYDAASRWAHGSTEFVPHAVYGLENLVRVLVLFAKGGDKDVAEAAGLLRHALQDKDVNTSRRPEVMRRGGREIAVLHAMVLDWVSGEGGGGRFDTAVRNRLEEMTAYAAEAGVLSEENRRRAGMLLARSDFEETFAAGNFEVAEAKLAEMSSLEGESGAGEGGFTREGAGRLSAVMLSQLRTEAMESSGKGREHFDSLRAFSKKYGVPGPLERVNVSLAIAEYELSREGSPELYLKAAQEDFGEVFQDVEGGKAWEVVAEGAENRRSGSALAFYLRVKRAEELLSEGGLSPEEEAAIRVGLGEAAHTRAKAALAGDMESGFTARPDYALAYNVVAREAKAVQGLLGKLDGAAAESTGALKFLLSVAEACPMRDRGALYQGLTEFVERERVPGEAALWIKCAEGRYLFQTDPSQVERAFELLEPLSKEVLSEKVSCPDPKVLLAEAGTCALRLGRWQEAEAFLEGARSAAENGRGHVLWEISLMHALAQARQGKGEGQIESLKEAGSALEGDEGQRHNVLRRLASVYQGLGKEAEFVGILEAADSLAANGSSSAAGGERFWHGAKLKPGAQSGPLPLSVPTAQFKGGQGSPALVEPGATTVKGPVNEGLDLSLRYVEGVAEGRSR